MMLAMFGCYCYMLSFSTEFMIERIAMAGFKEIFQTPFMAYFIKWFGIIFLGTIILIMILRDVFKTENEVANEN